MSSFARFVYQESFARLQRLVEAPPKPSEPKPLFLASAFLDAAADAAASDPSSPERPSVPTKPLRAPIRKRSAPFVRLVQRLVSEG